MQIYVKKQSVKKYYIILLLFFFSPQLKSQKSGNSLVTGFRLRADLTLSGTQNTIDIKDNNYFKEPLFSAPPKSFIDTFLYGQYLYQLIDVATQTTLYSNGFCSLFNEWQTTAINGKESYYVGKTLTMPFPKNMATLKIFNQSNNQLLFSDTICPQTIPYIAPNTAIKPRKIYYSGNPVKKLDILIMGDGYTSPDRANFFISAKAFADSLLAVSPFKENRYNINFWALCPASKQSGITYNKPNTPLGCIYNTIASDRYLYTTQNIEVANIASQTPYDHIIILTNSSKYGGGGIYNNFAVAAAGGERNFQVMIHEFAHTFAGLADEYAYYNPTDTTAYFSQAIEPWEPNITNLVQFNKKWHSMLPPNTPTPTPDSLATQYPIGLYEGAGYQFKAMYRPSFNCRMRTTEVPYFCPVCRTIIAKKIKSYCTK